MSNEISEQPEQQENESENAENTVYYRKRDVVDAYQVPQPGPDSYDKAEEIKQALVEKGVYCDILPDPTLIVTVGGRKDTLSVRMVKPGDWITIDSDLYCCVYSDAEFKRTHEQYPASLLDASKTVQVALTLTLNEIKPFLDQLKIGEAEGYESAIGTMFLNGLKEVTEDGAPGYRCVYRNPEDCPESSEADSE